MGLRIVAHGIETVLATLEEAKEIQAGDGMLRKDGKRRTLGGVFFKLMKRREEKEKKELKEAQKNAPKPPPDPEKEAALAAKKAAEKALAAERRAANRSKMQRSFDELMERYRAQKAALLSAREELEKEKATREKLEAELVALRAARPPVTQHRTRPSAPPGRVYRAPGGGR